MNLPEYQAPSGPVNLRELIDQELLSLQKHHLRFLCEEAPKLVAAINCGNTRLYLRRLYLQYLRTFPEQRLTLSTKDALDRMKHIEHHIYVSCDTFDLPYTDLNTVAQ